MDRDWDGEWSFEIGGYVDIYLIYEIRTGYPRSASQ
jgi:hypothetical protein